MSNPLECAARIDDAIKHTGAMWGALLGAVAGIILGAALLWFFPFLAVGLIGGAMFIGSMGVMVSGIGEYIGKNVPWFAHHAGDIEEGSPTVFIGAPDRNAARTFDKLKCHSGEIIVSGTRTIKIEDRLATRVKEETSCDGKIDEGCETVKLGGPSEQVAPKRASGELDPTFWKIREAVDIVTSLYGGRALLRNWGNLSRWGRIIEGGGLAVTALDKGLSYLGLAFNASGNYEASRWLSENVTDTLWYRSIGWTAGGANLTRGIQGARAQAAANAGTGADLPSTSSVDTPGPAAPAPASPATPAPAPRPAPAPSPPASPQRLLPAPPPVLALPPPTSGTGGGTGGTGP